MSLFSKHWKYIPVVSLAVLLTGCLSDDDTRAASTLSGTAATGAPIVGGAVTVDCASGNNLSAITTNTGAWSVTLSGQTAPCAIRVTAIDGSEFFSFAPVMGSIANVTPLTSLIVAKLSAEDPATWFTGLNPARFATFDSTEEIDAAVTAVTTALGLNTALGTNNPVRTAFTATNGNVIDDVLEAFQTALTNAGTDFATLLAEVRKTTITLPTGFNSAFSNAFATLPSGGGGGSTGNTCVADIAANVSGISAGSYKVCYTHLPTGFTCNQAGAGSYASDYAGTIQGLTNVSFSYQFSSAANCPSNALVEIDLNGTGGETGGNAGGTPSTVTAAPLVVSGATPATLNGTLDKTKGAFESGSSNSSMTTFNANDAFCRVGAYALPHGSDGKSYFIEISFDKSSKAVGLLKFGDDSNISAALASATGPITGVTVDVSNRRLGFNNVIVSTSGTSITLNGSLEYPQNVDPANRSACGT